MNTKKEIQELFCADNFNSLNLLLNSLNKLFLEKSNANCITANSIDLDVVDKLYFDEVKNVANYVNIYFGKTLKELKCVLLDEGFREHEIHIKYLGPRKYSIVNVNLPHLPYHNEQFSTIQVIIDTFRNHLNSLSNYFLELEHIDQLCSVMDPVNPTYKDDYRKIILGNRTWLHIEVTPDGSANNIHLVGQPDLWHDKLQTGILTWDHDKNIVDNIMSIFGISNLKFEHQVVPSEPGAIVEQQICAICLCNALSDNAGVPQPLCQNIRCDVYFHKSCLYEWLLASTGGRPPAFGVANGSCPLCFHPIACSLHEKL